MNSKRYDGVNYPTRDITDLRDLVYQSTELFADNAAYLEKDKKKDEFVPITYRQVKRDLEAFGTKLIDMGLKDKKIAVIGETSYLWFLTYFTTVCGVGVIVPLDKNLPGNELIGLIDRSGAEAIVYADKSKDVIAPLFEDRHGLKYLISMEAVSHGEDILSMRQLIEEGAELVAGGDIRYTRAKIDPDQMSTLLFTSGTTGMAKGVMLSHRNIANNVIQLSKYFSIPEPGIVFSVLPVHHVYAMTCDIWTTFYQGKTIAICEGLRYIQKNMSEVHPNVMLGVPLVFEKLYKGMWKQAKRRGEDQKLRQALDLSKRLKLYRNKAVVRRMFKAIHSSFGGDLKKFVMGGAAGDAFIMEEFEAMGIEMVQGYGMSECSPIIALNRDRYRKFGPVGQPVDGATVRIVNQDEDGIGEIIVKSDSVMMGYYENEEATAEAIQDGWLHTGDLGYFDEDGFLYISGRSKTVIVTKGGKNIFPEEVEDVLMTNELIQEVIVHGVEDKRVGNVMVTADIYPNYTLLKEQKGEMSDSDIYHFYQDLVDEMNQQMPPYKWIKRINIRTEEFAKTTTGKIKRYGNHLGDGSQKFDDKLEYPDIKKKEVKHAEAFAKSLAASEDPYVLYKQIRPVSDIRMMLEASCEKFGQQPAFYQKFRSDAPYSQISYRQLADDMNALGTAMMNRGLNDARIAVVGGNSYPLALSFLTVLCGVGVVIPMDKDLPAEELARLVKETEVSCVICDSSKEEIFRGMDGVDTLISLSEDTEELTWKALIEEGKVQLEDGDRQYLDSEIIADDMAMILYTSGTTGDARGVMISHSNLSYELMAASTLTQAGTDDVFFSVVPLHQMQEITGGLLYPLYSGAAVAYGQEEENYGQNVKEIKPTIIAAVPSVIENLYQHCWNELAQQGRADLIRRVMSANRFTRIARIDVMKPFAREIQKTLGGRMRLILSAGADIDWDILRFFNSADITAIRGYGLTECSPLAALNPDDPKKTKVESVGRLLPGMEVKLIARDDDGIGEIVLRGRNVMMGYYKDEAATAEVLKGEWFYTGDVGRLDENKFVYIVGRRQNVITMKDGRNIYPEDLEYELKLLPFVEDAMIWASDSEMDANDVSVAATIRLDADQVAEELGVGYTEEQEQNMVWEAVDKINDQLPLYKKIKRVIIRRREFEKTTDGKIKRFIADNRAE